MTSSAPSVGTEAPDFTLPSTAGEEVTLASVGGTSNVLLAFFPLAFTGTCTAELCDFGQDLPKFTSSGTTLFGISVDSVPTLKEFKSKHGIAIDLLSDFKRDVSRAYGTLLAEPFFSNRSYFIIDKHGVVRWTFTEDDLGSKRSNDELLAQLDAVG